MSSTYRRPRGTPKVALNLFVSPEVKALIDGYAARADVPIWAVVEAAVKAGRPGPRGLPEDWDLPIPQQHLDFDVHYPGGPTQHIA